MRKKRVGGMVWACRDESAHRSKQFPHDENMRGLVEALNLLPGVYVCYACGGHKFDDVTPRGHFHVTLLIEESKDGWDALGLLTSLCADTQCFSDEPRVDIKLDLISDHAAECFDKAFAEIGGLKPPEVHWCCLCWHLQGTLEPDKFAERIRGALTSPTTKEAGKELTLTRMVWLRLRGKPLQTIPPLQC